MSVTPRPMRALIRAEWNITPEGREAIATRLQAGCYGCASEWANLTVRTNAAGARKVVLQCRECGSDVGILKRAHHPAWTEYEEFDEHRKAAFWSVERERRQSAYEAEVAKKRANAADFYQSDTWRWMRAKVMQRAANTCEACLARPAQTVHHTTYKYGLKAPLYTLRALCHRCHERMHCSGDDWHDPELPAHYVRDTEPQT